jgi:REP element-mobilizing transposase RayT
MHFEPDALYHIYNRSNETIFYNRENYLFFLRKIKINIAPFCKILSWVLMPNHFHFLVIASEPGCAAVEENHRPALQVLSKNIGSVLSSYTQAINKQENRRGKLFSNNTEAKCLNEIEFDNALKNALSGSKPLSAFAPDYATVCFNYIHQNPVLAGLVSKMEDWEFSSFRDFSGLRSGSLINKDLAFEYIDFCKEDFYTQSQIILDETILKKLF